MSRDDWEKVALLSERLKALTSYSAKTPQGKVEQQRLYVLLSELHREAQVRALMSNDADGEVEFLQSLAGIN